MKTLAGTHPLGGPPDPCMNRMGPRIGTCTARRFLTARPTPSPTPRGWATVTPSPRPSPLPPPPTPSPMPRGLPAPPPLLPRLPCQNTPTPMAEPRWTLRPTPLTFQNGPRPQNIRGPCRKTAHLGQGRGPGRRCGHTVMRTTCWVYRPPQKQHKRAGKGLVQTCWGSRLGQQKHQLQQNRGAVRGQVQTCWGFCPAQQQHMGAGQRSVQCHPLPYPLKPLQPVPGRFHPLPPLPAPSTWRATFSASVSPTWPPNRQLPPNHQPPHSCQPPRNRQPLPPPQSMMWTTCTTSSLAAPPPPLHPLAPPPPPAPRLPSPPLGHHQLGSCLQVGCSVTLCNRLAMCTKAPVTLATIHPLSST